MFSQYDKQVATKFLKGEIRTLKKKIWITVGVIGGVAIASVIFFIIYLFNLDVTKAANINHFLTQVDTNHSGEEGQEMNDVAYDFINEHPDFFVVDDADKIDPFVNENFSSLDLFRNVDKQSNQIFIKTGFAYNIQEQEWGGFDLDDNFLVTHIYVEDDEGHNHHLIYLGEIGVSDNDRIVFAALPLVNTHFGNLDGGKIRGTTSLVSYLEFR
jgi:hypothetical protein